MCLVLCLVLCHIMPKYNTKLQFVSPMITRSIYAYKRHKMKHENKPNP